MKIMPFARFLRTMWPSKTGHNITQCRKMWPEHRVIKTKTQVTIFKCLYIGIWNVMMNMPINYVQNTVSKSEITKYFGRLKLWGYVSLINLNPNKCRMHFAKVGNLNGFRYYACVWRHIYTTSGIFHCTVGIDCNLSASEG